MLRNILKQINGDSQIVHTSTAVAAGFEGTSGSSVVVHGLRVGDVVLNAFAFSDGTDVTDEMVSPVEAVDTLEQETAGTDLDGERVHVTIKRG